MNATQTLIEQWRPVVGYEGLYEVSSTGQVRSIARMVDRPRSGAMAIKSRIRKQFTKRTGHKSTSLSRDGKIVSVDIHRLVAAAFIGPCPSGMEVRHLNGDAADNRVRNLKYGTRQENVQDMIEHGTGFEQSKTHCPRGHAYSGGNLAINKGGKGYAGRICRACRSASGYARHHGLMDDFDSIADSYYAKYIADDSQVVDLHATKRLAELDESHGVHIELEQLDLIRIESTT